jgi:hypothetical protein
MKQAARYRLLFLSQNFTKDAIMDLSPRAPYNTVIVDYRNICKIVSYSILSGSVACQYATEPDEIAHRLAKRLYCLRLENPEANIILATDTPPYWRNAYINNWYSDHGLEPIGYKANRSGMAWPFACDKETMDALYLSCLERLSDALDMKRVVEKGLEADDIWGIYAAANPNEWLLGISTDSDWQQCCNEHIHVYSPMTDTYTKAGLDIRSKCIAGDRGDNIMGCNKRKKNGDPGSTMWGRDGAEKLLVVDKEWEKKIDMEVFERNFNVVKLPCPLWKLNEAWLALKGSIIEPSASDTCGVLDGYGITEPVRKMLGDKAARDEWISKLRAHLQAKNEGKMLKATEPDPQPAPDASEPPAA